MKLYHLTLNTGDVYMSPRCDVNDNIINVLKSGTKIGCWELPNPFKDYAVATSSMPTGCGPGFTVYRKPDIPLVVCGMAIKPSQHAPTWRQMEKLYFEFTDEPAVARMDWASTKEPNHLPWLAVIVTGLAADIKAADWIGDFERCMAWAFVELEVKG
jgi:hypothetical protein